MRVDWLGCVFAIIASASIACITPAAAQSVNWSKIFGSSSQTTRILATAADAAKNVYVVGTYDAASLQLGGVTLTRTGSQDAFVAKLDNTGSVLWATSVGGGGGGGAVTTSLQAIAVDGASPANVYVAGNFRGGNLTSSALTIIGTQDSLAIKLNASGSVLWAQNFGGAGCKSGANGIAADAASPANIYLAGFMGPDGGDLPYSGLSTPSLAKIGSQDGIAFKLTSAGVVTWAKNFGGTPAAMATASGLAVDAASPANLYVVGSFTAGNLTTPALALTGIKNALVLQYDSNGSLSVSRKLGDSGATDLTGIAVDSGSPANVYVAGTMTQNLSPFASINPPASLTEIGTADFWAAKLTSGMGMLAWFKNFGGAFATASNAQIIVDPGNTSSVYLAGVFTGGDLTTPAITRIGTQDLLALKLGPTGAVLASQNFGGSGASAALSGTIADDTANFYLGGTRNGGTLTSPALTSVGSADGIVLSASFLPGAPPSVIANAQDGSALVNFTPPTSNGGSPITGYTVTSSPGGFTASGSGTSLIVSGLTNGTSYTFKVTATSGVGTGLASASSNAVTPAAGITGGATLTPVSTPAFLGSPAAVAALASTTVTLAPSANSPATFTLPSTVLPNATTTPLTYAFSASVVTIPTPQLPVQVSLVNGQTFMIASGSSLTGSTVTISYDPVSQSVFAPFVPYSRPGARYTDHANRIRSETPSASAPLPNPTRVTGPPILVDDFILHMTVSDKSGNSGTISIPLKIYAPGEITDLTAVSVDLAGNFGTGPSSAPALSRNGREVVFATSAPNLVGQAPSGPQIMRYSVPLGAVELVSQSSFFNTLGGSPANGASLAPVLSADGRNLAFASDAPDIWFKSGAQKSRQIYLSTSVNAAQVALSTPAPGPIILNGSQYYAAASDRPSLSEDGTWIAFESDVTSLVSGTPNGVRQIYVMNARTGAVTLASANAVGVPGNGASTHAAISDDGRFVLFESDATNFGALLHQVYLKDLAYGTLTLAGDGGTATMAGSLSADGRMAVYVRTGQVYRRSFLDSSIALVSVDATGAAAGGSSPVVSGDGRFAVFASMGANLVKGMAPAKSQIYVRDLFAGATALVSNDGNGKAANGDCVQPTISGNGQVIAFVSAADNLDGTMVNGQPQAYIAANPLSAPVSTGWWWDPTQPGQGFAIEERGNAVLAGSYLFAADGTLLWQIANDAAATNSNYSGPLTQYANGPSLLGPYRAPPSARNIGTSTLSLVDRSNASLVQAGASRAVQRYEFQTGGIAGGQAADYPEAGWWWNPATPGEGLFLEVQGTNLFAALFAYDDRGQPSWSMARAPMSSPASFSASLSQCQAGLGCGPAIGTLAIAFSSTLNGIVTLTPTAGAPALNYSIQRYRF